ncbi:MAG: sigma-54-dependent Fis family transcriptional regulator [Solirubrobacterales bacterium]
MIEARVHEYNIEASHERCLKSGLTREVVFSRKIIGQEELEKKFDENQELILTAIPYMEQLYDFVRGSNYFAVLLDKEGCILNVIGDDEVLDQAFEMKMIPGAYMDEYNIGTNAMSIALQVDYPVQLSGSCHFINAYQKWTCSAARILDERGELIGLLNLTGYSSNMHPHTLGMVVAASNAIQQMLRIRGINKVLTSRKKHMDTIFQSMPTGIITCNINNQILLVNKKAEQLFDYNSDKLMSSSMGSLIDNWDSIKSSFIGEKDIFNENVYIFGSEGKIQVNLCAYAIYDSIGNIVEIISVFEEIKKIRKLAGKFMSGQATYTFDKIIGKNENFLRVIDYAKKIADSKSTILIMGESGTGKELFSQSIHNYSSRREEPFIAVNCGAIPRELIESELFGYEEGAFTGAKRGGHAGKFEISDGGTIFLDEIGEMPMDMQTKLLRAIEEGVITRIGGQKQISVNTRVIAATNKDLKLEVENGNFRKDLYYRLNVLPIFLPPLRERKDDILPLINCLMANIAKRLGKKPVEIPEDFLKKMEEYNWPGNIRELENVVELIINTEALPLGMFDGTAVTLEEMVPVSKECESLKELEKGHIIKVLKRHEGNISQTATVLGIGRNTLYRKLEEYEIKI